MSITASRNIQLSFSGDQTYQLIQSALDNLNSLGEVDIVTLAIGNNTISVPVVSGLDATALTIIPPAGNVNTIILKGVAGDTGIPLHLTDPLVISLASNFVSLVLSVTAQVVGVRLIWS